MTTDTKNGEVINDEQQAETIADAVVALAGSSQTHRRLLEVYRQIEGDTYLEQDIQTLQTCVSDNKPYWDICCVLAAFATLRNPKAYLEIGVRRGRSTSVVAALNPRIDLYLFDLWHPDYAGVANPGPDFVHKQLDRVGHCGKREFYSGYSQETVPAFFKQTDRPDLFSMVTVDGDHRDEGARRDLDNVYTVLAPGGLLVFDDIVHPTYPTLHDTWRGFAVCHSDLYTRENMSDATGTALGIRS